MDKFKSDLNQLKGENRLLKEEIRLLKEENRLLKQERDLLKEKSLSSEAGSKGNQTVPPKTYMSGSNYHLKQGFSADFDPGTTILTRSNLGTSTIVRWVHHRPIQQYIVRSQSILLPEKSSFIILSSIFSPQNIFIHLQTRKKKE